MTRFFNDDGSVLDGLVFGDPYRASPPGSLATTHWDKEGDPSPELLADAQRVCNAGTAHPLSVAAQVVHAYSFACNTKSNYSTWHYWR